MPEHRDLLGELLETGAFSDLEVICQGYTFKLHKNIVFSHSSVMENELAGRVKGPQANRIQIENFDLEVVKAMVDYMYGKDYDVKQCNDFGYANCDGNWEDWIADADADERTTAYFHTLVHIISGHYHVAGLGDLAARRLDKVLEGVYDSRMTEEIIRMVFELSRDTGLQDLVARWSLNEVPLLMDDQNRNLDQQFDVEEELLEYWQERQQRTEYNLTRSIEQANQVFQFGCEVCQREGREDSYVLEAVPDFPGQFHVMCRNCMENERADEEGM